MRKLIIRMLRLIDRRLHPILSRFPELIEAPGANWRRLSELADDPGKARPILDNWFLVSIGYTEALAREAGIPKEELAKIKNTLLWNLREAVEATCRDERF